MKINHIIREKRKEQGLTQEQVAEYLGLSTPSVSKWESGNTFPDITILPALARLLKTDLNTLLSFKEDLTEIEIEHISNEIYALIKEQGFNAAFQTALEKISEYPTCEALIYTLAFDMYNALGSFVVQNKETYYQHLDALFERISKSDNTVISNQAISVLIESHFKRGEYNLAEELIKQLPVSPLDPKRMLARLYVVRGQYEDAAKLYESNLSQTAVDMQTLLMGMTQVAICEKRFNDAKYYADKYETLTKELEIMDCTAHAAQLEVAIHEQDVETCLSIYANALNVMQKPWNINQSLLYKHLKVSETQIANCNIDLLPAIIQELETAQELAFLREKQEYKDLLMDYKKRL